MSTEAKKVADAVMIMVCGYAAINNDDGTCTIVRGGIEGLAAPQLPANILQWIYAELPGRMFAAGSHPLKVSVTNAADVPLFEINGTINVVNAESTTRMAVPFSCMVQSYGDLRVRVQMGDFIGSRTVKVQKELPKGSMPSQGQGGVS